MGLLVLLATSHSAWAALSCSVGLSHSDVVPLVPPIISAGGDMPDGSVIYTARWNNGATTPGHRTPNFISCTDTVASRNTPVPFILGVKVAPLPLSSFSSGRFGAGIYTTNIPGIGIAVHGGSSGGSTQSQPVILGNNIFVTKDNMIVNDARIGASVYISLVKIGPLVPGSYAVTAASFPTMYLYLGGGVPDTVGFPLTTNTIQFEGQITVSSQTCKTPDVNVNLGTYEKSKSFNGVGSASPWTDASITLTDCPTFYGYYTTSNFATAYYGGLELPASTSTSNSVGVRLAPTTSVIDSAAGIMALDATVPGAASGVGIQLGWGMSNGAPTLFNFAAEQTVTLPKDGSPTVRIPLAARYIQTDANITPGKANGKVTFTINYY